MAGLDRVLPNSLGPATDGGWHQISADAWGSVRSVSLPWIFLVFATSLALFLTYLDWWFPTCLLLTPAPIPDGMEVFYPACSWNLRATFAIGSLAAFAWGVFLGTRYAAIVDRSKGTPGAPKSEKSGQVPTVRESAWCVMIIGDTLLAASIVLSWVAWRPLAFGYVTVGCPSPSVGCTAVSVTTYSAASGVFLAVGVATLALGALVYLVDWHQKRRPLKLPLLLVANAVALLTMITVVIFVVTDF